MLSILTSITVFHFVVTLTKLTTKHLLQSPPPRSIIRREITLRSAYGGCYFFAAGLSKPVKPAFTKAFTAFVADSSSMPFGGSLVVSAR